jgi:hypothetical protein
MRKNYLSSLLDDPAIASGIAAYRPPQNYLSGIAALLVPPRNPEPVGLARYLDPSPPRGLLFGLAPPVPTSLWLDWAAAVDGWWYLENAALYAPDADNVYVIWSADDGRWIRVGQGSARKRLGAHSRDPEILAYRGWNGLRASWARVHPNLMNGVERFLGDTLAPAVAERFPVARPITVNLPGE